LASVEGSDRRESRKMRRKRNRILKRLVLGFAVAALVVPSTAIAAVDEGGAGQPNKAS
jgi:hypothetical protein